MTDRLRMWTAAAVTALFLAIVSVAGVATRPDGHPARHVATPAATAAPPAVGHGEVEDDG
jgi:hypothetical protein